MRSLLKNLSNVVSIALLFASFSFVEASDRKLGFVKSLAGSAFLNRGESTYKLQEGDVIREFDMIFTEVEGRVTLRMYTESDLHLNGEAVVKIYHQMTELQSGFLWIQNYGPHVLGHIQTPNASMRLSGGEALIGFEGSTGKSQVVVVNGKGIFSSIHEPEKNVTLLSSQFSYLHKDEFDGVPRIPTLIGEKSFAFLTQKFPSVTPLKKGTTRFQTASQKEQSKKRAIASVSEVSNTWITEEERRKGPRKLDEPKHYTEPTRAPSETKLDDDIIFIKQSPSVVRKPASFNYKSFAAKKAEQLKLKRLAKDPRDYSDVSEVKVKVFGPKYKGQEPIEVNFVKPKEEKLRRFPASTPEKKDPGYSEFQNSYMEQYKKQMRHKNEVNSLIRELKSFEMDYQPNY